MLQLPDGSLIDMRWKSVSYITQNRRIIFSIEPMVEGADIVCIPKEDKCNKDMDIKLRNEFVFLLQMAAWKRDLKFLEMNIMPNVMHSKKEIVTVGTIENTQAGRKLEESYLFNPNSQLNQLQVKNLYIQLERRFANSISGKVDIIKDGYLVGSVMEKIVIPIIEANEKAIIVYL